MKNVIKLVIIFSVVIVFSTSLMAADFTFNVPVQLNNLCKSITHITVMCQVMDGVNGTGNMVGHKQTNRIPVSGSSFNQTIKVSFNADNGKNRTDAKSYSCGLSIEFASASTSTVFQKSAMAKYGCPIDDSKPFKGGTLMGNL